MSSLCERIEALEALSKEIYVTVWAEQNGSLTVGRFNFSFGNGNEHANPINIGEWGYVTHYPYEIVSMSIGMRLTNTADTAIQVTQNGLSSGLVLTVPGGQLKAISGPVSVSGSAGDTLNFQTVLNGGGNDVVPSILVKYTLP